jgi:predicted nucleotidyltransferase
MVATQFPRAPHRRTQPAPNATRVIALDHRVSDGRVFGSAMRGGDEHGSDLDLLVDRMSQTTLFEIGAIRFELKQLLGMGVDELSPNALTEKVPRPCVERGEAGMTRHEAVDNIKKADALRDVYRRTR